MELTQVQLSLRNPQAGGIFSAQGNQVGDLLVAQSLPPYAELVRRGNVWSTMSTAAVAALVVRPSTTAAFEIHNAYGAGGKSLIILRAFWHWLVSTAAIESASGWLGVTSPKAAVTSGNFVVRGASGKSYGGAVIAAASTTVVDPGWFPWGSAFTKGSAGVTPQGSMVAQIDGALIVPPGCSLTMHVVASLVGDTFTQGAMWAEEYVTCE